MLGFRQIEVLSYLVEYEKEGVTAPEVRDNLLEREQGDRGATRHAYGLLAKLEELGLAKRYAIPAKDREPRSLGGATFTFKVTAAGKKALKAAEKVAA